MKEYYDVIFKTMNLLDTSLEGLNNITSRVEEGDFESAVILIKDVIEAVYHIENSIRYYLIETRTNGLEVVTANLRFALYSVVYAYEHGQSVNSLAFIHHNLISALEKWREELYLSLNPYVAC